MKDETSQDKIVTAKPFPAPEDKVAGVKQFTDELQNRIDAVVRQPEVNAKMEQIEKEQELLQHLARKVRQEIRRLEGQKTVYKHLHEMLGTLLETHLPVGDAVADPNLLREIFGFLNPEDSEKGE